MYSQGPGNTTGACYCRFPNLDPLIQLSLNQLKVYERPALSTPYLPRYSFPQPYQHRSITLPQHLISNGTKPKGQALSGQDLAKGYGGLSGWVQPQRTPRDHTFLIVTRRSMLTGSDELVTSSSRLPPSFIPMIPSNVAWQSRRYAAALSKIDMLQLSLSDFWFAHDTLPAIGRGVICSIIAQDQLTKQLT